MFGMMLFLLHKTAMVSLILSKWRLFFLRAMAVFCNYSEAVCEAIIVVSSCNEILLKAALVLTKNVAAYLSVMLKLNAFLRMMLAGVLSSQVVLDQRLIASCSTWPSSQTSRNNSCSSLCFGGRRAMQGLKSVQAVLCVFPAIFQHSVSVCVTILAVVHFALSVLMALYSNFRPIVSTFLVLGICARPSVSVFQTLCIVPIFRQFNHPLYT